MGYDLLGDILGGQGKLWLLPIVRLLTFCSKPVDEIKYMAGKLSKSGTIRRKQLLELRKLSPDVSDKFVPPSKKGDPFGKAIGGVVAWDIITDMADRGNTFDLNFVLIQITACRMIAATAKALIPFENNAERRSWLKEVEDEYRALREELKEIINAYIRGEGAESEYIRGEGAESGQR